MTEREEIITICQMVSKGGYSTEILKTYCFLSENISFVRKVVYGTVENRRYLDFLIDTYSNSKKLDPVVREILRAAIFEFLFLSGKDYAVFYEYVEIAKKISHFDKFINAILRTIQNQKDQLPIPSEPIQYSIHDDLYALLKKQYQRKALKKICNSFFEPRETVIKIYRQEAIRSLEKNGFQLEVHPFASDAYLVLNPSGLLDQETFLNGGFAVQDGGSILITDVLNPQRNSSVLDLCAAPGSKTMNIALSMHNTGHIVANDIYKHKLDRIEENQKKFGFTNIELTNFDATKWRADWIGKFDAILLDVPCSGTGICRTKPEIKLNRTKKDIDQLVQLQKEIFRQAVNYTKKDGTIIYSTCSILEEENEKQREYFLNRYSLKPVNILFYGKENEYIKLLPFQKGTEGFFVCKFIKTS